MPGALPPPVALLLWTRVYGWPVCPVRGVRCQALSLPRPPILWGAEPGFCDPCVPGAVGAGMWTQHQPHSVRPCEPALLAVGVAGERPRGGGCLSPLQGASEVRRFRSLGCSLTGRAVGVRQPRGAVGAGVRVLGAQHCPLGLRALWGLRAAAVAEGRPRGGRPATVVRGVWCQALSLPRPPVLWGGQSGFRVPCTHT